MSQKSRKRDALRKEQALLHTFVAGQKYGVGRDDPPVWSFKKATRATDEPPVALLNIKTELIQQLETSYLRGLVT